MAVPVLLMAFIGGLLFGALDVFNRYTIWCGLIFHISLNTAWGVFDFSSSASGGWGRTISGAWRAHCLHYVCCGTRGPLEPS